MKCPNCGSDTDDRWQYCAKCGSQLRRRGFFDQFFSHFGREFEDMEKQMREMDNIFKQHERRFEVLDLSPFFRQPSGGRGFQIKIERRTGQDPKVSVQTFGDVKKEDLEEQLKRQLHVRQGQPIRISFGPAGAQGTAPRPAVQQRPQARPAERRPAPVKELPVPKVTEEPKTEVKRIDSRVTVEMELPGVRSLEDIRVTEMPESVEVRAVAGDKGFFKILTKPGQFRVSGKSFRDGKLHLEFS